MESVAEVMAELRQKGNPARVAAFAKHEAPADRMFGVSVADMKTIARSIRGQQELAYGLFETGNGDAMYLAGLVADGAAMTRKQLDAWARASPWLMIAEQTVPKVAVESKHARGLALKWMKARKELVAACGWATYARHVAVTADDDLDLSEIEGLLLRIEETIDTERNRVRYTMNGFVIAVGSHVSPLIRAARSLAKKLGRVEVELGGTSCKVPIALEAIDRAKEAGHQGSKRRSLKC